jgi:hypothetical protein
VPGPQFLVKPRRISTCHPDRPHYSKGFCHQCYDAARYATPDGRAKKAASSAANYAIPEVTAKKAAYAAAYRATPDGRAKIAAYDATPERKAKNAARNAACRATPAGKASRLARRYALSSARVIEMLTSGCVVCGSTKRLEFDHDHACCSGYKSCGKCVRGVLCSKCNRVLGLVGDNPDRLAVLAKYLRAAKKDE